MTGSADHRQTAAFFARLGADIDLAADDRLDPGLGRHGANSKAPNKLALSVMATAGMRAATHCLIKSLILIAPSASE